MSLKGTNVYKRKGKTKSSIKTRMNSTPRPKPWENNPPMDEDNNIPQQNNNNNNNTTLPPEVPPLPEDASTVNTPNNNNIGMNNNNMGYGNSYGGGMGMYGNNGLYGNTSIYGNSYGNGMYANTYGGGGMGIYGNSYGGMYGNGMNMQNGFNQFGMNGPGIVTESTMATFQLLENLIGAINGFAQMLESSYMATYNSFFTLVSFAEEISRLKQFVGSLFGMFNMIKLFKKILLMIKGKRKNELSTNSTMVENSLVEEFQQSVKIRDKTGKKTRRLAWKPLILFFMGVFGFPYLLKKYINRLQNNHIKQLLSKGFVDEPIDPMNLEFAKATYDFIPENPTIEITLKKGDLMAIISKKDTTGKESSWWRVRTKKGDVGYVPSNYIELIKRRKV